MVAFIFQYSYGLGVDGVHLLPFHVGVCPAVVPLSRGANMVWSTLKETSPVPASTPVLALIFIPELTASTILVMTACPDVAVLRSTRQTEPSPISDPFV